MEKSILQADCWVFWRYRRLLQSNNIEESLHHRLSEIKRKTRSSFLRDLSIKSEYQWESKDVLLCGIEITKIIYHIFQASISWKAQMHRIFVSQRQNAAYFIKLFQLRNIVYLATSLKTLTHFELLKYESGNLTFAWPLNLFKSILQLLQYDLFRPIEEIWWLFANQTK